ncbi:glycosyltransferase [Paenibacillus alginolyticus]|uniref:glycosyltransferase n=1 Tax=Paenibacillus alginolyticus TaxID=59839 RepID=UPI0028AD899E|nr:glycosyltransferase [Paenibacillus frigoriresistens]
MRPQQIEKNRNDWVCWIVGDGSKKIDLQSQCIELGLEYDVLFWGNRNDIPTLLSKSNIFVLPSLLDNQPLSIIEAQITGKPVIVSNAGGLPEMVKHGLTGVVSLAGDPQALCTLIHYLMEYESYRKSLVSSA